MPGSTRVLDRVTRTLVPCTRERCPLAIGTAVDAVSGEERPVNRPIACNANIVIFNAMSLAKYKLYAYNLFSYFISTEVLGSQDVLMQPLG